MVSEASPMIAPTLPFSPLRTEIAGIPVADLVREFGTPVFVYDAETILRRFGDLAAFDCVRYAQKACSNLAILDLVRRQGGLVDATSAGEIARALAAGFLSEGTAGEPPPIVYTADIFDREALELVTAHGIHVNCGSPDMIDQLGERVPGAEITLRINPGFGHGHSRKTNTGGEHSKHGIWHEELGAALVRAAARGLAVVGLHVHIGSGSDLHHLSRVAAEMERFAREVGPSVRSISAGGGLPVPYRAGELHIDLDAYFRVWDRVRRRLADRFGHPVRLEIEPGRYLVAESGYLLTEIRAIKRMGANTFYLVDAGFNNLARPILYGSYHPMSIVPREGGTGGRERPLREVVVGGQLCESGDIFTQEEGGSVVPRALPAAEVGEYLVMESAGAYGFVMSSNYNSKPFAAEVLVRDGKAYLIRERQRLVDLVRGEMIPEIE
jgi:diaminopimelate decarboxylase